MKLSAKNFICVTGLSVIVLLAFIPAALSGETAAPWTFMIYLDGDNNLDGAGAMNIDSMVIGMTPDSTVNVIVLWDRFEAPAGIYRITGEGIEELQALGEVDMDDPMTLYNFVKYAIGNYPADRYFLDLWNHGGGVFGVCTDDESEEFRILRPNQVREAVSEACSETNSHIDILGFDACVMSMVEVGYEMKDTADIMIASEMNIPFVGWPYEAIMSYLSHNPEVDPVTLSKALTKMYVEFYGPGYLVQLSAIDLDLLADFTLSLDSLAGYLSLNADRYGDLVRDARREALFEPTSYKNYNSFVDVYRFAWNLTQTVSQNKLANLAGQVMQKLNAAVFANEFTSSQGRLETRVYGFSIFFPNTEALYTPFYEVYVPMFVNATGWVEFLYSFFTGNK